MAQITLEMNAHALKLYGAHVLIMMLMYVLNSFVCGNGRFQKPWKVAYDYGFITNKCIQWSDKLWHIFSSQKD